MRDQPQPRIDARDLYMRAPRFALRRPPTSSTERVLCLWLPLVITTWLALALRLL